MIPREKYVSMGTIDIHFGTIITLENLGFPMETNYLPMFPL